MSAEVKLVLKTPSDPLIGRLIAGRLRVLEHIGSGSMGRVYRAHHTTLDKSVAIKVLNRLTGKDDIRTKRFVREARTASRLDHPHTVQILDFGDDGDGLLYLAMEYLEGEDLAAVITRERRLDHERVIDIMMQTLAGIAAAHDHGIIHRDLKPSNVFLTKRLNDDGQMVDFVKVCDFGVAKFLASTRDSLAGTAPGATEVVGTPLYMSPEQAVGDTLDARTDVYSAAVVMYEILTGRPPFLGETAMGVMLKHVSETPAAPSTIAEDIDPELESVLGWALVKDRDQRCPSAREFRNALREVRARATNSFAVSISDPGIEVTGQMQSYIEAMNKPQAADSELPMNAILGPAPRPATDPRLLIADLSVEAAAPMPAAPAPHSAADSHEEAQSIAALIAEAVEEVSAPEPVAVSPSQDLPNISGIDRRRVSPEVSDRARYVWKHFGISIEPYTGDDPFYVRDHRGEVLGPCRYEDVAKIIQVEGAQGHGAQVSLCGPDQAWMSAVTFAKLTGQEALLGQEFSLRPAPSASGRFSGTIEKTSLAALFSRITRDRPTGRLMFDLSTNVEETRIEIHLVSGSPTFVYSSEPGLQIPALLVRRDILRERLVPGFLQKVISQEAPLEQIVGREANIDMTQYRSIFMRERLCYLFRWQKGGFALDAETLPARMSPFAHSLMAVLPDVVYRGMGRDALVAGVSKYLHIPIKRSQWFNNGIAAMQLTTAQKKIVRQFLRSKTLAEAVPTEPKLEKLYYAMAYILLETELFLKPIGAR